MPLVESMGVRMVGGEEEAEDGVELTRDSIGLVSATRRRAVG